MISGSKMDRDILSLPAGDSELPNHFYPAWLAHAFTQHCSHMLSGALYQNPVGEQLFVSIVGVPDSLHDSESGADLDGPDLDSFFKFIGPSNVPAVPKRCLPL